MKIQFKKEHFIPLGTKPSADINPSLFENYEIVIFDNNFCLVSKKLKELIDDEIINISFEYNYKLIPEQTLYDIDSIITFIIDNKKLDLEDIQRFSEYLPSLEMNEETLFYLKLHDLIV